MLRALHADKLAEIGHSISGLLSRDQQNNVRAPGRGRKERKKERKKYIKKTGINKERKHKQHKK